MKVVGLNGRTYHLSITNYLIDWTPKREVSAPQAAIKRALYPYWRSHVVTEETRIPGTRMRIDLMNWTRRLAIEVSPQSSHSFNSFFHKNRHRFGAAVKRDLDKGTWCELNGFALIELDDAAIKAFSAAWVQEHYDLAL